jgi:hypothetical protein
MVERPLPIHVCDSLVLSCFTACSCAIVGGVVGATHSFRGQHRTSLTHLHPRMHRPAQRMNANHSLQTLTETLSFLSTLRALKRKKQWTQTRLACVAGCDAACPTQRRLGGAPGSTGLDHRSGVLNPQNRALHQWLFF